MRAAIFLPIALLTAMAAPCEAQKTWGNSVRAWFRDGTGLEIYTESTGATQPHTFSQGVIGITRDRSFRIVTDKNKNQLFGYYLDAKASTTPGAVSIRIEPYNGEASNFSPDSVPTVATVREFPAVRIGEAVTLEMLYNPSTGEKIYDVIRPMTDESPSPTRTAVTGSFVREQFSFKEISLRVNGQAVDAPSSWMIGGAARIDIPGHGMFVLAASDPKNMAFKPIVVATGKALNWLVDGDRIDIASKTNVLMRAENAVLWVFHDPHYKSSVVPYGVGLQTADSVEWLLPRK
jgi:hypothetical protein